MDARVSPASVGGSARAPPSKSYTHRAILVAGLAGETRVLDPLDSADTRASQRAAEAFGATIRSDGEDGLVVSGCDGRPAVPTDVIDCENSGTTMRLTLGIAGLVDGMTVLTGDASLRQRPQGPLLEALTDLGASAVSTRGDGTPPVVVDGPMAGGEASMPGDVSSQFVSSLLLAGALTSEGVDLHLETELKSAPYVEITREVLDAFGVETAETADGFRVPGEQSYRSTEPYAVPGDFSSISYLAAAGAVAGDPTVVVDGAVPGAQGDTAIVDVLDRMGAAVSWDRDAGRLTVGPGPLSGIEVDVGDTPDLLPTIAAVGAHAEGTTRIVNCEHVRYKETDRVAAMASELSKMGASVDEAHETLTIHGGESTLTGAEVEGFDDHRIVMALTIAALGADGVTTVRGAEHVDVSFPDFFGVLEGLGAAVELV